MLRYRSPFRIAARHSSTKAAAAAVVEVLESRTMRTVTPDPGSDFAHAFNVGDLNGQVTLSDAVGPSDTADVYKFTMPRDGEFFGRVRAQAAPAEIDLIQEQVDPDGQVHDVLVDFRVANQDGADGGFASGDLPGEFLTAGNYFMFVSALGGDTSYLVRMTADYAGSTLGTARDIGSATDGTFQDFVGQFDTPSLNDSDDFYKFKMDAPGQLVTTMSLDSTDFNTFKAHVAVIHDFNNNGVVDPGDTVIQSGPATTAKLTINLAAGTYFVRVTSDLNFSNYHLRINADYAGVDGFAPPRAMGSLDHLKSFNDFIDTDIDANDEYTFSLSSRRTFFAAVAENGDNATLGFTLYLDQNHDGIGQDNEIIELSNTGHFESTLRPLDPGQYVLRVQAVTGGGTYQLAAEARPDQAGNTLATAKNLGTVNGLLDRDDYLTSQSDPVDFYKFTMAAPGRISAALSTNFGGDPNLAHFRDANLSLIRDTNNNGKLDANEVLTTATLASTGAKELTSPLAAGTYFLRIKLTDTSFVSKYFLTLQADYAGSRPATARNVGALSGTRAFDDWASGPFTGVISDTADVYKFTLASLKTFTAKMHGSQDGEDLDLQLFVDKNHDGVLTANEMIASSAHVNSPNEQITKALAAGTYYVRVLGVNGETNYHLTLSA